MAPAGDEYIYRAVFLLPTCESFLCKSGTATAQQLGLQFPSPWWEGLRRAGQNYTFTVLTSVIVLGQGEAIPLPFGFSFLNEIPWDCVTSVLAVTMPGSFDAGAFLLLASSTTQHLLFFFFQRRTPLNVLAGLVAYNPQIQP